MENKQKPTPGRIVRYNSGGRDNAALIVHVFNDECINLVWWNEHGSSFVATSVLLGEGEFKWSWPQRA